VFCAALQVVAEVLTECGSNIDAAIKRLGELRLAASAAESGSESSSCMANGRLPRTNADPAVHSATPERLQQGPPGGGGEAQTRLCLA
jgi:hypothetical protein